MDVENDVKNKYESFWKDIVENEDGTLNKDQVMRELYDFSVLIGNISKVYCHITDGKVSKPLTDPDVVIALADDSNMSDNDIVRGRPGMATGGVIAKSRDEKMSVLVPGECEYTDDIVDKYGKSLLCALSRKSN